MDFLFFCFSFDQTCNFVFDTGASKLVLNRTYFRNNLLPVEEPSGNVTGNVGKVDQMRVRRLEFSGLYYENLVADVINLGHIENRRGVKILGLFKCQTGSRERKF